VIARGINGELDTPRREEALCPICRENPDADCHNFLTCDLFVRESAPTPRIYASEGPQVQNASTGIHVVSCTELLTNSGVKWFRQDTRMCYAVRVSVVLRNQIASHIEREIKPCYFDHATSGSLVLFTRLFNWRRLG
jgi:hypothetical protein